MATNDLQHALIASRKSVTTARVCSRAQRKARRARSAAGECVAFLVTHHRHHRHRDAVVRRHLDAQTARRSLLSLLGQTTRFDSLTRNCKRYWTAHFPSNQVIYLPIVPVQSRITTRVLAVDLERPASLERLERLEHLEPESTRQQSNKATKQQERARDDACSLRSETSCTCPAWSHALPTPDEHETRSCASRSRSPQALTSTRSVTHARLLADTVPQSRRRAAEAQAGGAPARADWVAAALALPRESGARATETIRAPQHTLKSKTNPGKAKQSR